MEENERKSRRSEAKKLVIKEDRRGEAEGRRKRVRSSKREEQRRQASKSQNRTFGALVDPSVVVQSVTTDVDHGVESGRTAPNSPTRPIHHPIVHVLLRHSVVKPVVFVVA